MEDLIVAVCVGPPLDTNGYLIGDRASGEALLVDAPRQTANVLIAEAQKHGLRVSTLVNTHGHFDHIGDNAAVLEAVPGCTLLAHPDEVRRLEKTETMFPLPYRIAPTTPTQLVNEGDTIACGQWMFTVLHTPGHSEGSVCLYCAALDLLVAGDTLFAGSFGRTDLPGGDDQAMKVSLQRLAALPPETTVLPGHGPATMIGDEQAWILDAA